MADDKNTYKAALSFAAAYQKWWFRWFLAVISALDWFVRRSRWLGLLATKHQQWLAKRHPEDKLLASGVEEARLLALLKPEAPWEENKVWLDTIEKDFTKSRLVSQVVMAYVHNQRLRDAKMAAQYWLEIALAWAQQHPQEASRALKLRRRQWDWYGPRRFIDKEVVYPADKKALKVMMETHELDQRRWLGARDATAALGFIRYLEDEAAKGHAPLPKKSSRLEKTPWLMQLQKCDEKFAQRIEMPPETFDDIWRHATHSKYMTEKFKPNE